MIITKDSVVLKDTTIYKQTIIYTQGDTIKVKVHVPCPDAKFDTVFKKGNTNLKASLKDGVLDVECNTDSLQHIIDSVTRLKQKEVYKETTVQVPYDKPVPYIPKWVWYLLAITIALGGMDISQTIIKTGWRMTLAEKTLAVALLQEGVREKPKNSNSGPEVNIYLQSVGLKPGYPWCMAFVYWCVATAAKEMELKNPLVKTGGVQRQWNETTCRKLNTRDKSVKPGDIFIMKFPNGTGHTGIVEKVAGQLVYTIEGNTNDDGSREGYEVAKRQRLMSTITGFIQL